MNLAKASAFFRRDLLNDFRSRASFLLELLNIGLSVASYVFLSRLVPKESLARWVPGDEGYFAFVLVGMAANAMMMTALTGLSRSLQLQQPSGVLKPLLFSQTRPEAVLLYSSCYPMMRAGLDLILYLLSGWFFSGLGLARANFFGAALVAGLAIAAFGSLGLISAAFTVLFRLGNPILWVIGSGSWLLGGVLYPTHLLPLPLRWMSQLFPVTHALNGLRAALQGAPLSELIQPILMLAAFAVCITPLGVLAFRLGLRRARIRGTLNDW